MLLPHYGLVTFTWGNVSGIDREKGLFVIKPSGVDYEKLTPEDMVVVDLNGNKIEGDLNPSSDTATHVVLYNRFPKIGGVVHTHSPWATSWAQAGRGIPCYGTTHADYLYGEVPCVRNLTKEEIDEAYEKNTGVLIADEFAIQNLDYIATPAVLCKNHGPFTWGKDAQEAVHNAVVLEEVAKMAARAELINPHPKFLFATIRSPGCTLFTNSGSISAIAWLASSCASKEFRYLAGMITSVSTLSPYLNTCPFAAFIICHLLSLDLRCILRSHLLLLLPVMPDKSENLHVPFFPQSYGLL